MSGLVGGSGWSSVMRKEGVEEGGLGWEAWSGSESEFESELESGFESNLNIV